MIKSFGRQGAIDMMYTINRLELGQVITVARSRYQILKSREKPGLPDELEYIKDFVAQWREGIML